MNQVESYSIEKRKENGVFYTPIFLADYLSQKVLQYHGSKQDIIILICGQNLKFKINNYRQHYPY